MYSIYSDSSTTVNNDLITRTIYVDRTFSDQEVEHIVKSALIWNNKTNTTQFSVKKLPVYYDFTQYNPLLITKVSPDTPEVISIENGNTGHLLGYYNGSGALPYIAIVADRVSDASYVGVVLHELGHSVGLQHNTNNKESLMYPTMESDFTTIPDVDIESFCKMYSCYSSNQ